MIRSASGRSPAKNSRQPRLCRAIRSSRSSPSPRATSTAAVRSARARSRLPISTCRAPRLMSRRQRSTPAARSRCSAAAANSSSAAANRPPRKRSSACWLWTNPSRSSAPTASAQRDAWAIRTSPASMLRTSTSDFANVARTRATVVSRSTSSAARGGSASGSTPSRASARVAAEAPAAGRPRALWVTACSCHRTGSPRTPFGTGDRSPRGARVPSPALSAGDDGSGPVMSSRVVAPSRAP